MVTGGDSCSEGCGFESQHCILNGHFSHIFAVKIVMFVGKGENKRKRGWGGPFFKRPQNNCLAHTLKLSVEKDDYSLCGSATK